MWILAVLVAFLLRRKIFRLIKWLSAPLKKRCEAVEANVAQKVSESVFGKLKENIFTFHLPQVLSDTLVKRILEKLPEAMEARALKTISNLTAQVNGLRKQINEDGWVTLGVHVRGFKLDSEDKDQYFALIQFNTRYGGLRAVQDAGRRKLVRKQDLVRDRSPFKGCPSYATHLGAPWYGKVDGDPKSIVMLGEAYTLVD
ncbi:MAG: hypothetical protein JWN37_505 [Candidatus Nomurabacteria bacterium]|nr:hypothetical protein [Candidatus Nomurabacteria bacterium]